MTKDRQLGDFLQSRRSQLRPQDAGLDAYGQRRRVAGLRREELAMLAGVSESYYARLERGESSNASPQVLDALARVLRLDESERQHLHDLATRRPSTPAGRVTVERVSAGTSELLAAVDGLPAVVLGRRTDVLAWNSMGHALFAGHLPLDSPGQRLTRPNMARLVFTDGHTRALYGDWPAKAKAVVATLRRVAGQHPDDAALSALIGELTVRSPQFAGWWADHRVKDGGAARYDMLHPSVGALSVTQTTLTAENGQTVVIATTPKNSPSAQALALLRHSIDPQEATAAQVVADLD